MVNRLKIAIIPNLSKQNALAHTIHIIEKLNQYGAHVSMELSYKEYFEEHTIEYWVDCQEMIQNCDAVIAVGGDGTIIHSAKHAAIAGKPILGINVGRLGFVAGLEMNELDRLKDLIEGNYSIENRMMLSVFLQHEGNQKKYSVLNDAVLARGALSRILDFKVSYNENNVCEYRADGLIVATPTGSTAYSLSAGGPVIDPTMQCMILSPICPHSLITRTVVFGPNSKLRVKAHSSYDSEIYLTLDGETSIQIENGEAIEVSRSDTEVKLINLKDRNFYEVVNEKLAERRN